MDSGAGSDYSEDPEEVENERKLIKPDKIAISQLLNFYEVFEASLDIIFCNDYVALRKMKMTLQIVMRKRINPEKRTLSGKKQWRKILPALIMVKLK